jgi:hypothetical protein
MRLRLKQVLVNLIGNAGKVYESGHIEVKVRLASRTEETATVQFEVVDTGIGIELQEQARLFQKFNQVDSSRNRKYGGTGLGLRSAKDWLKRWAGRLESAALRKPARPFILLFLLQSQPRLQFPHRRRLPEGVFCSRNPMSCRGVHHIGLLQSLGLFVEGAKDDLAASAAIQKAAEDNASFGHRHLRRGVPWPAVLERESQQGGARAR